MKLLFAAALIALLGIVAVAYAGGHDKTPDTDTTVEGPFVEPAPDPTFDGEITINDGDTTDEEIPVTWPLVLLGVSILLFITLALVIVFKLLSGGK